MYILIVIVDNKPFSIGPFPDIEDAIKYAEKHNLKYFSDYCVSPNTFEFSYLAKAEVNDV